MYTDSQRRDHITKLGAALGHELNMTYPGHDSHSCDHRPGAKAQAICSCGWKSEMRPYSSWDLCYDEYAAHLEAVPAADAESERIAA